MKRVISFSLFGARNFTKDNFFEFAAYMRGFYWNVRMAKLFFPDWQVHCEIDSGTFSDYDNIFYGLQKYYGISFSIHETMPLCKSMLTRLKPLFFSNVEYVLCRDADALITYREAQMVKEFTDSGLEVHSITDNVAHTVPLMGGLCGFKCHLLKEKYKSWDEMLALSPVQFHEKGSDQTFLTKVVYPAFRSQMFAHHLEAKYTHGEAIIKTFVPNIQLGNVSPKLWESNLCVAFAGAAGVNELETLRFLKRFDTETEFEDIAKRYNKIFYWYNL